MIKTLLLLLLALPVGAQNHKLTPGAVATSDTAVICKRGYASSVRLVPKWEKDSVYKLYHASKVTGKCCEVDHLISLELGGSNKLANLWPMPYPAAYAKDSVENVAHQRVCSGKVSLIEAQTQIAKNWRVMYRKYFTHL
jgi:hypothetical protein